MIEPCFTIFTHGVVLSSQPYITLCILYSIRLEVEGVTRRSASRMSRRVSEPSRVIVSEQNHVAVADGDTSETPVEQDCTLTDQVIMG